MHSQAIKELEKALDLDEKFWLAHHNLAEIYIATAIQERDPFAVVFASVPYGKGLRESPRWPKLAKMMNLWQGVD